MKAARYKDYIQYHTIYIKFKDRQNKSILRKVITVEKLLIDWERVGGILLNLLGNVLYFDVGGGFMEIHVNVQLLFVHFI